MSPTFNDPIDGGEADDFLDDTQDDDSLPAVGGLLGQLGGLQNALAEAQQAAAETVTGRAGNGAVVVTVNGGFEFSRVAIRPEVVDPADVEMLEDLVLAALNDAAAQLRDRQAQIQSQMLGGLGDLGRLFGQS